MRKSILLFVVALVACGGGGASEVAGSVGQTEITVGEVRSFPLEETATLSDADFAQYLGALIQWQILDDAAQTEFGIDPGPEEVDTEITEVLATQGEGQTLAEIGEAQNLSEETMRRIFRVGLIQRLVAEQLGADLPEPSVEEVETAMTAGVADNTEICTRHVLVETEEEAVAAKQRLEDGEDFATVATEMSTDPSAAENQGDLGCALGETVVSEYRDAAVTAEIDAISQPVQTQYGFHVIQVYERTEPGPEDMPTTEEVLAQLGDQAEFEALQAWLVEKVDEAEVTVAEEYGTWTLEPQPGVQPPPA